MKEIDGIHACVGGVPGAGGSGLALSADPTGGDVGIDRRRQAYGTRGARRDASAGRSPHRI